MDDVMLKPASFSDLKSKVLNNLEKLNGQLY